MKKIIFILIISVISITSIAQSTNTKLKVFSAATGFGGFSIKKGASEGGGASFLLDVTFSVGKNLLSTSYLTGAEIGILEKSNYNFDEFSVLYGREWTATNWLRFEGFAGLGSYHQKSDVLDIANDNSISFPIRINTKFYFTKKFGMGINTNYSFNSVNNNFSNNLIFHYRFN